GYDEDFVNALEDDLQCAICQLALKNPMLTKCGHRFCRQCLDEHFKSQQSAGARFNCPVDRSLLIRNKDLFPDKATERKILSFSVRCPSEGCQWSGELRAKDVHLESCPLKVVSCTNENCNETITRNNLQAHVTTTCPWRILQCSHCSSLYPACKTEVNVMIKDKFDGISFQQAHELDCTRKPLNCRKNCGAVVPREEVRRKEIESHLQEAVRTHVDLAFAKLTSTQEELERSHDLTSKLNEKFNDLERQLKLFEAKFKDQQLIIRLLSSNDYGEKVNALERKVGTFQTQLQNRVETVEMILKDDSRKVDSLEKSFGLLQRPLNPMRRVEQKEKGYEVESNPFYLGKKGYKCKLYMGIDFKFGPALKIDFVIMQSENDIILPWPFRNMVTYELIDQQKKPGIKCKNLITKHRPLLKTESQNKFLRPILEENERWTNISHRLSYLSDRGYLLNDTVIIK
ncbi:unnamed protein product, partial [Porites evermanni]